MVVPLKNQSPRPAELDYDRLKQLAYAYGDQSYADFVTQMPFEYYVKRVEDLGFTSMDRVIDVGCGFGQWAAALALFNGQVIALERHEKRLGIAKALAERAGLTNVETCLSDALTLPYDDNSMDAVFCYGVLMFVDRGKGLDEFYRVLKPGGKLYVCANGFGWWLQTFFKYFFKNPNARRSAWNGMRDRNGERIPNCTNLKDIPAILSRHGFDLVKAGPEGTLCLSGDRTNTRSAYPPTFFGFDNVIEYVAKKKLFNDPAELIDGLITATLGKKTYEYVTPLRLYPMPRPVRDLATTGDVARLREVQAASKTLDRVAILQRIFTRITRECTTDREKVLACIFFVQRHFFHHFAGQPMASPTLVVFDPIINLQLGYARCGHIATFLADLFLCNGFDARTLGGACHTSCEVLCDGQWLLAEANLYPPGIYPKDRQGNPLSTQQMIAEPALLDRVPSYINYHHAYIAAFLKEYPETDAPIGFYLRNPILPSSGFLGRSFYKDPRPVGSLQRMHKKGTPKEWAQDEHFGWLNYHTEVLEGTDCPTRFRPTQVQAVRVEGEHLTWQPCGHEQPELTLRYRLMVSPHSRGWDYRSLPVGCDFTTPGTALLTREPRIALREVQAHGRYVSIMTEVVNWGGEEIFYLPSDEFDLRIVCGEGIVEKPVTEA